MNGWVWIMVTVAWGPVAFERHGIDAFPAGYQVAVADINGDDRPDVIALSTEADRVDWYENPGWKRRPVARTAKNIDVAAHDVDGDGKVELALAAGFYFNESKRGGEIYVLRQPATDGVPWVEHRIAADPVVHRLRWGDLDGDGRKELIHAPIFGPGSDGARAPQPAHLRAYVIPARYETVQVETWKIDETLTVLHGLHVADLDGDGRDELLTASFEGIFRFDLEGQPQQPRWQKKFIAQGAAPASDQAGASRGSSEIAVGKLTGGQTFLAAIEPWHGNQVVVYRPDEAGGNWHRQVLDDTLREGHALVIADFDQDGVDEIVAGWRADGGGLRLYDPTDAQGSEFRTLEIDPGMPVEGLVAADMNADRRLDLVANAGRKNALAWYENKPQ